MLPTPAQTFARMERAHANWTRGGATISVSAITSQGADRAQYRLDLDGAGGATLRIKSPSKGSVAATDQAFTLRGNTLTGIDFVANERLVRPAPAVGAIGLRLTAVLGGLDDAVGFLSSKELRARYLEPLKALSGWRVVSGSLVRRTGSSSYTRLDLDTAGRLKSLHIEFPGSRLDWKIAYGAYVPLKTPPRLKLVEAFTQRPNPPRYANAEAKQVVEALLRAGGGLRSAIVRIDDDATLWLDGPRVRYEKGGLGFAYDGQVLTLTTPRGVYQGRTSRNAVIDYVASLLGSVDPMVRSVLVRTPPYAELFGPSARVRVVGKISDSGQPCDVLAIDSPRYRTSMFVRRLDHLPASIETEVLANGTQVSRTTRSLKWSSVGVPLAKSLFALRLRPGQVVQPLPPRAQAKPIGSPSFDRA